SARGRLTVHLRVVAVDQFRVGGAEEETGYGEAAVAAPLCDAGLLEEVERPAAGSDEDELRVDLGRLVRAVVADGDLPAVGRAFEVGHGVPRADLHPVVLD